MRGAIKKSSFRIWLGGLNLNEFDDAPMIELRRWQHKSRRHHNLNSFPDLAAVVLLMPFKGFEEFVPQRAL